MLVISDIARAFPSGIAAFPEDLIEEESEELLGKNGRNNEQMRRSFSAFHSK